MDGEDKLLIGYAVAGGPVHPARIDIDPAVMALRGHGGRD